MFFQQQPPRAAAPFRRDRPERDADAMRAKEKAKRDKSGPLADIPEILAGVKQLVAALNNAP